MLGRINVIVDLEFDEISPVISELLVHLFISNDRKQKKTHKYKAQSAKTVKRTTELSINQSIFITPNKAAVE